MDKTPPLLPTLPLHLMMSMGAWLASPFAYLCANAASPLSKLAPKNLQNLELEQAVLKEAESRAHDLLTGILRYLDAPYKRDVPEKPAVWKRGNARLLDYGDDVAGADSVALFIPSLINRYYILDLEKERSMLRFFATQGIHPLVLDWDAPGDFEDGFNCEDYIANILLPAIDFIYNSSGKKLALAGYCMGGNLAFAAAQLAPNKISKLALLATPWNFHCKAFAPFVVDADWQNRIASMLMSQETLPADVVQSLFYMTDPWVFEHKFRRYAGLQDDSRAAKDFIALERWVNDGVPLTSPVARDCLIGWAQKNDTAEGRWKIADKIMDPAKIKLPTFIAIPQNDHIVPYDCALPLAESIKHATVIEPSSGHVGMIVGGKAKKELWQPLADWILSR